MNPFKLVVNLIALLISLGFLGLAATMVRQLLAPGGALAGTFHKRRDLVEGWDGERYLYYAISLEMTGKGGIASPEDRCHVHNTFTFYTDDGVSYDIDTHNVRMSLSHNKMMVMDGAHELGERLLGDIKTALSEGRSVKPPTRDELHELYERYKHTLKEVRVVGKGPFELVSRQFLVHDFVLNDEDRGYLRLSKKGNPGEVLDDAGIRGERILRVFALGMSLLFFSLLFVGTTRNLAGELGYAIPW